MILLGIFAVFVIGDGGWCGLSSRRWSRPVGAGDAQVSDCGQVLPLCDVFLTGAEEKFGSRTSDVTSNLAVECACFKSTWEESHLPCMNRIRGTGSDDRSVLHLEAPAPLSTPFSHRPLSVLLIKPTPAPQPQPPSPPPPAPSHSKSDSSTPPPTSPTTPSRPTYPLESPRPEPGCPARADD